MRTYTLLDHTADLGIRVFGKTLDALFVHAGNALFELLVKPSSKQKKKVRSVSVSGMDWPDLMVNWLRELLFLWIDEKYVLSEISIRSLTEFTLTATVELSAFASECDTIIHDIKAVTYHQIEVKPVPDGWEGRVIFDV